MGLTADDRAKARRIAAQLAELVASGDVDVIGGYLVALVGRRLQDPQRPRFSSEVLAEAFAAYPGGIGALLNDLNGLGDPRMTPVIGALLERAQRSMLDDARFTQLEALGFNEAREATFPELVVETVVDLSTRLYEAVDELLRNARDFYSRAADDLAADGHWVLAGMLATAADFAVPATPVQLALSVTPWGRLTAISRVVAVQRAQRIAARAAARLSRAAVREAQIVAGKRVLAELPRTPYATAATRTVDDIAEYVAKAPGRVEEFIQVINKRLDDLAPASVKEYQRQLERRLAGVVGTTDEVLDVVLKPSARGARRLDYVVLDDGRVIQRIHTGLYRRQGVRGASAAKTMKKAGYDADLTCRDWGHIVSDVNSGPDLVWNYVLMCFRVNRSYYRQIDGLLKSADIEGLPVSVYIEFKSIEAAQLRVAERIVWDLPGSRTVDPRYIVLGNLLECPVCTFREFTRALEQFFARVRRSSRS